MKYKIKTLLSIIFFCFYFTINAYSQISISNFEQISRIKNGTTYVVMNDPNLEKNKDYIDVLKNNWTISKIQFIKYSEIDNYMSPQSSFLTLDDYFINKRFSELKKKYDKEKGNKRKILENSIESHFGLSLWTFDEKHFQNSEKNKEIESKDIFDIAYIPLQREFASTYNPYNLYENYGSGGHIRNWGPGILKNYIQTLMYNLDKNENRWLYLGIHDNNEIKNLKEKTLYIPDYVLIKFNSFNGDETSKNDEKSLFGSYKLNYKIISTDELNKKILEDKEAFYYLVYVKDRTDKYVYVVNSLTGEIIYSNYTPLSYNIKSSDLKSIQKEIVKIK